MNIHFQINCASVLKLVLKNFKDDIYIFSFPGPGDKLPVLLPERRGAVRHPGALGPLEAGAGRGSGELLHSVILLGEQPRSRVFGECNSDTNPVPAGEAVIIFSRFVNIRKGLR